MGRDQDACAGHSLPLPSKLLARLHEVSSVFSSESHTKAVSLAIRERKLNGALLRTRVPSHNLLECCTRSFGKVPMSLPVCNPCNVLPAYGQNRRGSSCRVRGCRGGARFCSCDHPHANREVADFTQRTCRAGIFKEDEFAVLPVVQQAA